jgi:uncharacterized membrane protein
VALRTERLVARLLFFGGVASVALMLAGLIALEVHAAAGGHAVELPRVAENRQAGRSVDVFVSMPALVRGLRQRPPDPVAIATTGVVVLLLTPVAGLLAALVGFARERDGAYVVISALLIAALLFGFALRLGG